MKTNCSYCNKELERQPWQVKKCNHSFCNHICNGNWKKKNLIGTNNPSYKKLEIKCDKCGKKISRSNSQIRKNNFCCHECYSDWLKGNKKVKKHLTIVNCSQCNKKLEKSSWEIKRNNNHFCDKSCHGIWRSKNLYGENHPSWKGGRSVYKKRPWYLKNIEHRKRYRKSTRGRLNHRISVATNIALRGNKKGMSWENLVEYTYYDLKTHLEKQFSDGMDWSNIGLWHIDHIIPKSSFDYKEPEDEEFKKCWSLSNLQPLWAIDNLRKSNKILGAEKINLEINVGGYCE